MRNIYERVLDLMGESKDSLLFARFVEDLGERPETFLDDHHSTEYMFIKTGLALSFMEGPEFLDLSPVKGLAHAFFHLAKGYSGSLPAGIDSRDNRKDVETKLGLKPETLELDEGKNVSDEFSLSPFFLSFVFQKSSQKIGSFISALQTLKKTSESI